MQRRSFFSRMAGAAAIAVAAGTLPAWAQTPREPEAPVVSAPKIIEALTPKDVVLDRPGQPGRPPAVRRDPAIHLQVQFTFDSAELMPQGKRQLDELAMALNDRSLLAAGFVLAGHTDRVGDADYNLQLSHARAEAVKAYLAEVHRIAPARLQTIGYGFSRLLDPRHPTAAVNRRVEVRRLLAPTAGRPAPTSAPEPRLVPTPR